MFEVFGLASLPEGDLRECHSLLLKEMYIYCLLFIIIVLIIMLLRNPKIMAPASTVFNWTIFLNFYFIKILIERQWHPALIIQCRLLLDRVFREIFKRFHDIILRYICGRSNLARRGTFASNDSSHFSRLSLFIFVLCTLLFTCSLRKL
jgi:hypothetical protein